jgi:ribosomal protein S18 acetylase RimI-like enzyme
LVSEALITSLKEERIDAFMSLVGDYLGEQVEYEPDFTPAPAWEKEAREFYLREMQRPGLFIRLITWDEKPFGFAVSGITDVPFFVKNRAGYIADVFVRKEVRRYGFGTALVRDALDILQTNGANSVQLNALSASEGALQFWEKFGFESYMVRMKLGQH